MRGVGVMRIFASWSGKTSREAAIAFREWLPKVIQSISVFVSSKDIEAGDRWGTEIAEELKKCDFGVVFVTKSNKEKPWLLFEAGALSKRYTDAKVVPVLCNILPSEISGNPLSLSLIHI